TKRCSSK
ncbi:Localization factor PodJL, partial [Haemophilus influenzae]